MQIVLLEADLITPDQIISKGALLIEGKKIKAIGHKIKISKDTRVMRLPGKLIVPGFIDLHVHGALGEDFTLASDAGYEKIISFFLKHGTTTLLPVIYPRAKDKFLSAINRLVKYCQRLGSESPIYGLHLEGPFLNPMAPAVLRPERFWPATLSNWRLLKQITQGWLKMMTLAPEIVGGKSLLKIMIKDKVVPTLGHSCASYEEMESFIDMRLSNVTHIFNAMSPLHHRQPNALTSALLRDEVFTHLIGDGVHVHAPVIKLLLKLKGVDKICLISDTNIACGMPDGYYNFAGYKVKVKDNVAKTMNGILAGSMMPLDAMLRYMVKVIGLSLSDAIKMVTINPARALGIERTHGSLSPGKQADLVVLDKNLLVKHIFLGGMSFDTQGG